MSEITKILIPDSARWPGGQTMTPDVLRSNLRDLLVKFLSRIGESAQPFKEGRELQGRLLGITNILGGGKFRHGDHVAAFAADDAVPTYLTPPAETDKLRHKLMDGVTEAIDHLDSEVDIAAIMSGLLRRLDGVLAVSSGSTLPDDIIETFAADPAGIAAESALIALDAVRQDQQTDRLAREDPDRHAEVAAKLCGEMATRGVRPTLKWSSPALARIFTTD